MRTLYLDCGMGAAGDMLQGALVSLLTKEKQESFINEINDLFSDEVCVKLTDDVKCGITASHISVSINGHEEHSEDVHDHHHEEHYHHDDHHEHSHHDHHHDEHHHDDHHEHGHAGHHHASMDDIRHIISHLNVSEKVKKDAISIYEIVAAAESKVHGKSVSEIHFHEVGMKDAIADIVGVAMLIEKLSVDRIICSPVNTGYGKVRCAHGILPVPAPATAEIIKGIPVYAGKFEGEMLTPTGAAILKYYSDEFSSMPVMQIEDIGYGSGNKDFESANVVRAVIGNDASNDSLKDNVIELRCNVDDMTGEDMAYAVEILVSNGARDAFVTPVFMKKGRSGFLLTVLCDESNRDKIAELIFKHTSTIGIRQNLVERLVLKREEKKVKTEAGEVSVKISEGYGVRRVKPEYEDLKTVAEKCNMSISAVRESVLKKLD